MARTQGGKKIALLLGLMAGLGVSSPGFAGPPGWCEITPRHDALYRNYVGRASAPTLDQAFQQAVEQARREAVEENFGFQFHVSASANERDAGGGSEGVNGGEERPESLITQDVEERSPLVVLEKFQRVDSYSSREDIGGISGRVTPGFSVCVWYRYPVEAMRKERKRLSGFKLQDLYSTEGRVIQGAPEDKKRGVVVIESVPAGASVRIDGRDWGETPVELLGKLTPGEHTVVLDHPDYVEVTRFFQVSGEATTRVHEILRKKGPGRSPSGSGSNGPWHLLQVPSTGFSAGSPGPATEAKSEVNDESDSDPTSILTPSWYLNLMMGGASSPIQSPDIGVFQMGLSVEYFPIRYLGIRLACNLGMGAGSFSYTELTLNSTTFEAGIPIHFLWPHLFGNDSLFVEPKAVTSFFTYSVSGPVGSIPLGSTPTQVLHTTGLDFGYRFLFPPAEGARSLWGVTVRGGEEGSGNANGGFLGQPSYSYGVELNYGW